MSTALWMEKRHLRATGPWGARDIPPSVTKPAPIARVAKELGLPASATLVDLALSVANKSWDEEGRRWVDDPAP
jgi:hypothetical protein